MKPPRKEVAKALRQWKVLYSPPPKNKSPRTGQSVGADGSGTDRNFSKADCKLRSEAAQLHHALNLLVDSSIAADDALDRNDVDGLSLAISILARNAGNAQTLALVWAA